MTVNLTEDSRRNPFVFHLEVQTESSTIETRRVFVPKLTACGTNTQTTIRSRYCATNLLERLKGTTSPG